MPKSKLFPNRAKVCPSRCSRLLSDAQTRSDVSSLKSPPFFASSEDSFYVEVTLKIDSLNDILVCAAGTALRTRLHRDFSSLNYASILYSSHSRANNSFL